MRYLYTARFLRSFKKFDEAVRDDIIQAVELFERKEDIGVLKIHKLHGKFKKWHAFSENFSYRIIIKIEKDTTYYLDVGIHDIYK
ncbi:MAG: hypothetical protein Q8Q21_00245 [bacterium]|nr:hypothetical protein [bacterium]